MPALRSLLAALGLSAALAFAFGPAEAEAQVGTKAGVAAAVRGPVQQISYRTPQATVGRTLAGGQEIFLGDRIVTGPGGGLQILLLDGTTFSLGPNTSMVIDEFVFNPATGTGKLAAIDKLELLPAGHRVTAWSATAQGTAGQPVFLQIDFKAPRTVSDDRLATGFDSPGANEQVLLAELGIVHTGGVGGK